MTRCDSAWRLSRRWGVVAVCAWACASASAQEAAETVVRLLPSAVVSSEVVRLSDVAELQGDAAALVAEMELGAAPHVGRSGVVELEQLQSMLARRGVNLANWVFRGASRCSVQRVAGTGLREGSLQASPNQARDTGETPVPHQALGYTGKMPVPQPARRSTGTPVPHMPVQQPTSRPADGTEASRAGAFDPASLEALLRRHLAARLSELGGTPQIRFSPGAARVLALAEPTYQFRITDRSERTLGMIPLEVTVFEGNQALQTVPVIADVSLRKTVLVAARSINRGEILKPSHLLAEERTFDRIDQIGLDDPAMLIGQQVKRFIEARAVVTLRDVEPMPLVHSNDLVTVLVRRGSLTIRGSAKALSTGGLGETVRLRNEMSREVFTAVVTGLKTAEVREPSQGPQESTPDAAVTEIAQSTVRAGEDRP